MKSVIKICSSFLFPAIALLVSCDKDEVINRPVLTAPSVSAVTFDGATFDASVIALNSSSWTEIGFTWGTAGLEAETSVAIGQSPARGKFTQAASYKWTPNTSYNVRFYIKNATMVVYSAARSFKSPPLPPPAPQDFNPKIGTSGTHITVTGNHFTEQPVSSAFLQIGAIHCPSLTLSNTQMVFEVPVVPLESKALAVVLVIDNVEFPLNGTFTFLGPTVTGVTPSFGVPGTIVTITGTGFSTTPSENAVRFEIFGSFYAGTVLTASPTELTVATAPDLGGFTYNVYVRIGNVSAMLPNSFTIVGSTITEIVPASAYPGQTVTLNGVNFSPVVTANSATFNGVNATILTASTTQITLTFPPDITSDQRILPGTITLISGNTVAVSSSMFTPLSPWHAQQGPPGAGRSGAVAFSIGQFGYVGTGLGGPGTEYNDFWQYDTGSHTWSQKADVPGGRSYAFSFAINGKGYIGGGRHNDFGPTPLPPLGDLWEYDPNVNTWTKKQDFPSLSTGESRFTSAMTIGSKAYVIDGTEVYQYDPSVDQWTKMTNPFPGTSTILNSTFDFSNQGYFGLGLGNQTSNNNEMWRYTPAIDQWTRMADYPGSNTRSNFHFTIGNLGYIGDGLNPWFYQYNPSTNTWTRSPDFPTSNVLQGLGFEINGQGYGMVEYQGSFSSLQMYRFDPNY